MAINNVIVQYNGGFLPDIILLLTQLPIVVWFDGADNLYYYYNISVQYNGGFLPDIILLTRGYYHRRTRLNAMERFCLCSLYEKTTILNTECEIQTRTEYYVDDTVKSP